MIVPMKKVSLLIRPGWADEAISLLEKAGMLHVSHVNPPEGGGVSFVEEGIDLLERVMDIMKNIGGPVRDLGGKIDMSEKEAVAVSWKIIDLDDELKILREEIAQLEDELEELSLWGDFDPAELDDLAAAGIELNLFSCGEHELEGLPADLPHSIIRREDGRCYVAAFLMEGAADISFRKIALPKKSPAQLKEMLVALRDRAAGVKTDMREMAGGAATFTQPLQSLKSRLEFEKVRSGMGMEDEIAYIVGFMPAQNIEMIRRLASDRGWGLLLEEPSSDDPVPTLIRHSAFSRLFQPVMDFVGIMPGYFEYDTNGIFLVFFSLFFAMIVGDAGYGLLILAGAFAAGRLFPRMPKERGRLFVVLSITTIIWGGVTGNWFGIDAAGVPLIGSLIIPGLSSVNPASGAVVMEICFFLALMHLSVAHLWKGLVFMPSARALSETGWVMLLIGIYMIVRFLVLKTTFPESATLLIALGFVMVLLFSGQQRDGFVKGLKRGLSQFPLFLLDGIGGLSNIVSYVRLFAVGIASKEVALAFNGMAIDLGFDSLTSIFLAVLVLVFGHLVNLILIAMSVIVHGIRLNILEFSGQMKMEWSGTPYEPFGGKKK